MKYTIYLGATKKLMSEAELADMLILNQQNNRNSNITGMMIYTEGTFMQVLEGNEDDVRMACRKIEQDVTTKNVIKLAEDTITKPNFRNWSMAFLASNLAMVQRLEGYINPTSKHFLNTDSTHAAVVMLKSFAKSNRISYTL